jgi:hypothetical protein
VAAPVPTERRSKNHGVASVEPASSRIIPISEAVEPSGSVGASLGSAVVNSVQVMLDNTHTENDAKPKPAVARDYIAVPGQLAIDQSEIDWKSIDKFNYMASTKHPTELLVMFQAMQCALQLFEISATATAGRKSTV